MDGTELTPEHVFKVHYGKTRNPATPVVVEYGWIVEGTVAYELSRSGERDLWGLTLVAWDEGQTVELEAGRWAGVREKEGRIAIDNRKHYYGSRGPVQ